MPARTGAQFLAGLRDNREVWLGGQRVIDPMEHPALRGAAQAIADVYDLHYQYPDDCLMPDPETGEPIAVSHMIPRSKDDLLRRHKALRRVAEFSVGLMGRTPDYMNVTYAGFAGRERRMGDQRQRGGRGQPGGVPEGTRAQRPQPDPHADPRHVGQIQGQRARPASTKPSCTRWKKPSTASSCEARGCWRRWRRSLTSLRSIPASRCPTPAGATRCRSASAWTPLA